MPAIPPTASFLENAIVHRDTLVSSPNVTAVAAHKALEVVCAWPVSGQYGPGTRALYVSPQTNKDFYDNILTHCQILYFDCSLCGCSQSRMDSERLPGCCVTLPRHRGAPCNCSCRTSC